MWKDVGDATAELEVVKLERDQAKEKAKERDSKAGRLRGNKKFIDDLRAALVEYDREGHGSRPCSASGSGLKTWTFVKRYSSSTTTQSCKDSLALLRPRLELR